VSDDSVAAALRSNASLVLIEAPAGCGKTHQAAEYAHWLALTDDRGQTLILTHTHAACDVFRARTHDVHRRVHITTIDGLIAQVAGMYHVALGLPFDTTSWARAQKDGFEELAKKVVGLLTASKAIVTFLVARYPVVLCDEHQDANAAQHAIIMLLLEAGAKVRVFGDPMQSIYVKGKKARKDHHVRWLVLRSRADKFEKLDYPHRWDKGSPELGHWVLGARDALESGNPVDLRKNRPANLTVLVGNNTSPIPGGFMLEKENGRQVRNTLKSVTSMMILSGQNATVRGVNAYLGRSVPIWEGHTREALSDLVAACLAGSGEPVAIAEGFKTFVQSVAKGFGDSDFAKRFVQEVISRCTKRCTGKPAQLQALARCILEAPNHLGVARALTMLDALRCSDHGFADIKIDLMREFWEAIRLGTFDDPAQGLAEITRRRNVMRSVMPQKVISTVHKAKGLESDHVLMLPCDKAQFGDSDEKRCLLYVALSRARSTLTLVVSPSNPSPLLIGP
jgi:hypothetical protein